eukprot:Skav235658  [mRNA]  locus=scaffold358:823211:828088:+ [translate_table: standard]
MLLFNATTTTSFPKDRGVAQEFEDTAKNPTDQMIQSQVEKAASCWEGLETEEGLVPLSFATTKRGNLSDPNSNPKAKAQPKRRAGAGNGGSTGKGRPEVLAAKLRTRSTKEFLDAERMLKKAKDDALSVLEFSAPKVLGPENVATDPTLDLLRERLELVNAALDSNGGNEASKVACARLFELACRDPYLKDCRTTLLADEAACQTLGACKYVRSVVLDLQPTEVHVHMMMETHRNSLELLKKVADCLLKESTSWSSVVAAIQKAKVDEERITQREEQKAAKLEAKQRQRQKDKEAKELAKKKKKEKEDSEKHEDAGEGQPDDEDSKKQRVRAKSGQAELTDSDPPIFHGMFKLPFGAMSSPTTATGLVQEIANDPGIACLGRFRTGMLKKVLTESRRSFVNNVVRSFTKKFEAEIEAAKQKQLADKQRKVKEEQHDEDGTADRIEKLVEDGIVSPEAQALANALQMPAQPAEMHTTPQISNAASEAGESEPQTEDEEEEDENKEQEEHREHENDGIERQKSTAAVTEQEDAKQTIQDATAAASTVTEATEEQEEQEKHNDDDAAANTTDKADKEDAKETIQEDAKETIQEDAKETIQEDASDAADPAASTVDTAEKDAEKQATEQDGEQNSATAANTTDKADKEDAKETIQEDAKETIQEDAKETIQEDASDAAAASTVDTVEKDQKDAEKQATEVTEEKRNDGIDEQQKAEADTKEKEDAKKTIQEQETTGAKEKSEPLAQVKRFRLSKSQTPVTEAQSHKIDDMFNAQFRSPFSHAKTTAEAAEDCKKGNIEEDKQKKDHRKNADSITKGKHDEKKSKKDKKEKKEKKEKKKEKKTKKEKSHKDKKEKRVKDDHEPKTNKDRNKKEKKQKDLDQDENPVRKRRKQQPETESTPVPEDKRHDTAVSENPPQKKRRGGGDSPKPSTASAAPKSKAKAKAKSASAKAKSQSKGEGRGRARGRGRGRGGKKQDAEESKEDDIH